MAKENNFGENQTNKTEIFTVGHSNVSPLQIIKLLQDNHIDILVDVRSSPYSKYASQFNKSNIEDLLKKNGIDYRFAGDYLGGRPTDPTCYKNGVIPEGQADYLHLVDYPAVMTRDFFQKGIQGVLSLAQKGRVCLMCSEEDPAQCHRHHLIGRYLTEQGVDVFHIRWDGNIIKDQQLPNLPDDSNVEQLRLI